MKIPDFNESRFDTIMAKNFDVNLDKIHEAPWQVIIQGQWSFKSNTSAKVVMT